MKVSRRRSDDFTINGTQVQVHGDCLYIKAPNGTYIRLRPSAGPMGLGLEIYPSETMSVWPPAPGSQPIEFGGSFETAIYHKDEKAQAYKQAYANGDLDGFYRQYPKDEVIGEGKAD